MHNPIVKISVPSAPPVVTVPVPVPPVIKLAGGVRGKDGAPGVGVPTGGTTRQALVKASGADYDTIFETLRELPTTPTGNPAAYGGEYVLTTNAGTPPAWEARGQIPVPGAPGPEGAVHHLSWQRNTPGPAWITTAHIPYIGLGTGLPRHTLIVGDGDTYRWVQEDPIPALPDESGQFLGIQDGALAWLHPIPPAIAGTDPQTLTIPANTPTEVAKNLFADPLVNAIVSPMAQTRFTTSGATNSTLSAADEALTITLTGPVTANASIIRLNNWSQNGQPVTGGQYYSLSLKMESAEYAGGIRWDGLFWDGTTATTVQTVLTEGADGRLTGTLTAPANATRLTSLLYYTASAPTGTVIRLSRPSFTAGDPIPFFTGDTPPTPTTTYQWDGPPHNSPSTKYAVDTTTQWTPITLIPPPPPTGTWTLTTTNGTISWEQTP